MERIWSHFDPMVSMSKQRQHAWLKSSQIWHCLQFVLANKTLTRLTFQQWLLPYYLMPLLSLSSLRMWVAWDCPTAHACNLPKRASRCLKTSRSLMRRACLQSSQTCSSLRRFPRALTVGRLHEIPAYEVSAKSKMRLKGAVLIVKFYINVEHPFDFN